VTVAGGVVVVTVWGGAVAVTVSAGVVVVTVAVGVVTVTVCGGVVTVTGSAGVVTVTVSGGAVSVTVTVTGKDVALWLVVVAGTVGLASVTAEVVVVAAERVAVSRLEAAARLPLPPHAPMRTLASTPASPTSASFRAVAQWDATCETMLVRTT
jgi:hypothetical protein